MYGTIAGGIFITGTVTRDAEYRLIGDKKTPIVNVSAAVNEYGDPDKFIKLAIFGDTLIQYAQNIKKGDSVCAAGNMDIREYNGKMYSTLSCKWLNFVGKSNDSSASENNPKVNKPKASKDKQISLDEKSSDDAYDDYGQELPF